MIIEDGRGRGFKASVSSTNRLNASAKSNPRIYYISRDDGQAYSFESEYNAASGDYVICIKNNNSTKNMIISGVWLSSDNNSKWQIDKVSGTASGTTITGRSLNLTKNNKPDAESLGNAAVSGITNLYTLSTVRSPALTTAVMDFKETLILGDGDELAVKYIGGAGEISVIVGVYFESHSGTVN